jgi:hypothetical protein
MKLFRRDCFTLLGPPDGHATLACSGVRSVRPYIFFVLGWKTRDQYFPAMLAHMVFGRGNVRFGS